MTDEPGSYTERERLREELAAAQHDIWGHWQQYMHSKMEPVDVLQPNGKYAQGYLLPVGLYERWERQINTSYADLSDAEKASDMEQVDRYWPLIAPLAALAENADDSAEAYEDRNLLVLALMTYAADQGYAAGFGYDPDEPEWPVAYIDLPHGQVSWRLPKALVEQLSVRPEYSGTWDGHTSAEKRARLWAFLTGEGIP